MKWNDYFEYDPVRGALVWKNRPREHFNSDRAWKSRNNRFGGKPAGSIGYHGTPVVLDGKGYMAHRIIWEMHNGPIPDGMVIDHIDGNEHNNWLANLRLATGKQNSFNSKRRSTNTSGYKGVSFVADKRKFKAAITVDGKHLHLGYYDNPAEAHGAYIDAATKHQGQFARFQ